MKILYLPNQYSQQRQKDKKAWVYPVLMAMQAEYYRDQGHDVNWGGGGDLRTIYSNIVTKPEDIPFNDLPAPDRTFTNALDKKYQRYGNYKYHPATHMQVADGCWHGGCSFCVEEGKRYVIRDPFECAEEVEHCFDLGFKEIFDDSGTFPNNNWMTHFIAGLDWFRVFGKVTLGCNLRIDSDNDFEMMKKAGFRMVLFGVESFNQYTLDRLNKGIEAEDIIPCFKRAAEAGLEPHAAFMSGYPWESIEEEMHTIEKVKWLLRKGYAKTAQCSVYDIPHFQKTDKGLKNKIYDCAYYPDFWFSKLKDIKNFEDFLYLLKSIRKGIIRD